MTESHLPETHPEIPTSAWVFAWLFVVSQALELARRGTQSEDSWPLSILLSVAVVLLFSHGVMRAGMVRFWIVAVLMGIVSVLGVVALFVEPTVWTLATTATSVAQVVALHSYYGSPWFAWQRTRPEGGPSLTPILLVAVLVGVMGGLLGADSSGAQINVSF